MSDISCHEWIVIYYRKTERHNWLRGGACQIGDIKDLIRQVFNLQQSTRGFLYGWQKEIRIYDPERTEWERKPNYQVNPISLISMDQAQKIWQFAETGAISVNPPLFAKMAELGILNKAGGENNE